MYLDVVEVRPEPGYRPFVRFHDGLNGQVRLREDELTWRIGTLEGAEFFRQVYVEAALLRGP